MTVTEEMTGNKEGDAVLKESIRKLFLDNGAVAAGFAEAREVDEQAWRNFRLWLENRYAGDLAYMHNYLELRRDPRLLLEGAQTIISCAWSYNLPDISPDLPIARYALVEDYHRSIRRILKPVVKTIETHTGCRTRICIDSAPVMERYWALKSGIGMRGSNGCVIIPGAGSRVFLSEILLTLRLPADEPKKKNCGNCGKCIDACPSKALCDGLIDCSRCLSALTIESPGKALPACSGDKSELPFFGCDKCQDVCPHNRGIQALSPLPEENNVIFLTKKELLSMTEDEFTVKFSRSALKRAGLKGLKANIQRLD